MPGLALIRTKEAILFVIFIYMQSLHVAMVGDLTREGTVNRTSRAAMYVQVDVPILTDGKGN